MELCTLDLISGHIWIKWINDKENKVALTLNTYLDKVPNSKCMSKDSQVECLASTKNSKSKPQPDIICWGDSLHGLSMACSQQAKSNNMPLESRIKERQKIKGSQSNLCTVYQIGSWSTDCQMLEIKYNFNMTQFAKLLTQLFYAIISRQKRKTT